MSETPETGAISIDQAAGLLNAELPKEERAPEAPQEAEDAPPEAEEQPEEQPEPVEAEAAPEAPEEAEPATEGEPIDPPLFWKAEDKAKFADLPREAQERIREYEDNRVAAHNRQLEEAATARKAYEAETAKAAQVVQKINDVAERAEANFKRPVEGLNDADGNPMTWDDVNWNAWYQADPQNAAIFRSKYEFEQAELQRVKTVQQEAAQQAQQAALTSHVEAQSKLLSSLAPELASDATKRQAIGAYLVQQGYSQERLLWAEAPDLVLAHKAMLYDELQARARAAGKGAPQAPTQPGAPRRPPQQASRPPVRPAPANTAPSPKTVATEAFSRFSRSGKIDDAVAALTARGSG